jgi:N-acetylglucosamine-6-sulfatase
LLPRLAAAAFVAALSLGLGLSSRAPAQDPYASGPNIVVIMSDDQAPGMMRALPAVQSEIASRGTTFENAIASYPLCCPARATFITGQYAHNNGVLGNNRASGGGYQALIDKRANLATWLQANGYETAFAGKWLNGVRTPHRSPPGWDLWSALVGEGGDGLSSYYDFNVFEPDGTPRRYGDANADYQTDVLTRDYAVPFISAQSAVPGPFFLWLSYHPPHFGVGRDDRAGRRCSSGPPDDRAGRQSAIPPARYAKAFHAAPVPHPPSFDEADVKDKPKLVRRRAPLSRADLALIRRDYRCGLAALLALNDGVKQIAATLDATGERDNTVLVFLTDQGVLAGEHRIKRGKNKPYEEALRIPLMISGPGVAAGQTVTAPVSNADIAPTLMGLAGATMPKRSARPLDGSDLAGELAGVAAPAGRVVPIEGRDRVARSRHGYKVLSYAGVRTARYSYVEYRRAAFDRRPDGVHARLGAGRTVEVELYDLARDPYELKNLAKARRYREPRRQLSDLTRRLERCFGADCVATAAIRR